MRMWLTAMAAMCAACETSAGGTRRISLAEFRDRMEGAWLGQSIGVVYGSPAEAKWNGVLVPEDKMPVWTPELINGTFGQDDLFADMFFIQTLERHGLDVSCRRAGIDFANSEFILWGANYIGRNNIRRGIAAPASSHPSFHTSPDGIDYQIEADYSGILAPGIPQAAVDLGEIFGRIMNYGDGLYGGQFVGAMYANAYFESNRVKVVREALRAIPAESKYAGMVRDMLAWHEASPHDWKGTWAKAVAKYGRASGPLAGVVAFRPIEVKINGAMLLLGLLYGEGDLARTMRIATSGGYDTDCNTSSACGVLGVLLGAKRIDGRYVASLSRTTKWRFTEYDWNGLMKVSEDLARKIVVRYGGRVENDSSSGECLVVPVRPPRPSALADSRNPGPVPADAKLTEEEMREILFLPSEKEGKPSVRKMH